MNIQLPIESVDSLVDIVLLGKSTDISYQRDVVDSPPKITYTICFSNLDTPPWEIHIHPTGGGSEITFPVRVQRSHVIQSSALGGSTIEIISGKRLPAYDNPIDKAKHVICHSIYLRLKSREPASNDPSITQRSDGQGATARVEEPQECPPWENMQGATEEEIKMIKMLVDGASTKEIANAVAKAPGTTDNIISDLRRKYPKAKIPKSRDVKKLMRYRLSQ